MNRILLVASIVAALGPFATPGCASTVRTGDGSSSNQCTVPDATSAIAPTGACDGMGQTACRTWAESQGGSDHGYSTCSGDRCIRADRCSSNLDPQTCQCGNSPPCGPTEVCVTSGVFDTPHCRCALP
jgi:hypothetical protein